ncbi:hypothetical protein A2960_01135 [Candidatus Gottesmanbacteria bacterium RIFCSPLOWO2_01_FULL_39_12b]|uniref:Uncharacterized protein n=1 Tax=Candidatus Gottesmanbacteria bacterium RIFCSPLOWO2_01_FULL_39_12b TaxID=1798388 RepID=A0A1F6APY8_9BACT|nr:MAG: hypothetical protein A2960_01135 [Candidatus Gottesmanbacteria bacterium RIFCSPLOWO2_01_FULL_39_12b]
MNKIVTLILAGGDSSRFWPLRDKHFIKFLDKPLICYSISQLIKFGFTDIVIVVSQENQAKYEILRSFFTNINLNLVTQVNFLGMAGAVISAAKFIKENPVLIVGPSDIHENILLDDFTKLLRTKPEGILAGIALDKYFPGGYLTVKKDIVTGIVEKPSPNKLPSNIVNFVFDYLVKGDLLLDSIKKINTKRDDHYEQAIELLIKKGHNFKFLPYKGFWGYLKYPWNLLDINSYFLNKIHKIKIKSSEIADSSNIVGNVIIEEGVKIMENVKIIGPVYIGKGTIIGQNCLIRESMIGNNCVIGFSTEIARSHIGDNCWFHNNYIGDSVLSENISMGAGAILANYKLNKQPVKSVIGGKQIITGKIKLGALIGSNVNIGVNASIMPGVKIGQNSVVGSGVVLDIDLPEKKVCYFKNENYTITDNKF